MRRKGRVDRNQAEIVEALRRVGATVESLAGVGDGVPDLLVGFRRRNYLLEVKAPAARLAQTEWEWHVLWRGTVTVVRSIDDALRAIGAMR